MYKIIGADGKEYGPVSGEQIKVWIGEGRLNAQSQIQAEGSVDWKALEAFPEFTAALRPNVVPPFRTAMPEAKPTGREAALRSVNGPAVALKIFGGLLAFAILFGVARIVMLGTGTFTMRGEMPDGEMPRSFAIGIVSLMTLVNIVQVALIFVGAARMQRLQNFGLAMAACIVAMLPCGFCCIFGLPIGIWGLVVLNQPNVKSQFN